MNNMQQYHPKTIVKFLAKQPGEISLPLQDEIIRCAVQCLESRIKYHSDTLKSFEAMHYLRLQLAQEQNKVFAVLFLDTKHRALAFEKLFYGTIDEARIHPRVVIQRALAHNAAAVILAHNHPSGVVKPSTGDLNATKNIEAALKLLDIRLLDHIIVSTESQFSFADNGLMKCLA